MPTPTQEAMAAIVSELQHEFIERDDEVHAIAVTFMARENGLAFGEPGTGKSLTLHAFCSRLLGAKYGRWLMDRQMGKEELLGPIDLPLYKSSGEWTRNITDTLLDCHLAFFDEVGKTGPGVTTPLLTAINEGIGKPGTQWIDLPLVSAFGASNEELEDQAAFDDRFPVRLVFRRLQEMDSVLQLLESSITPRKPQQPTYIDLADVLEAIDNEVPKVEVPRAVLVSLAKLRFELEAQQIFPSDRRIYKCIRLLQAVAWMEGRSVVEEDDLAFLRHVLWSQEIQRTKVATACMQFVGPVTRMALTLATAVQEVHAKIDALANEPTEIAAAQGGVVQLELTELNERLANARADAEEKGRRTERLDELEVMIKELQVRVYVHCMKTPEASARRMVGLSA